jgi:hypothetical protein
METINATLTEGRLTDAQLDKAFNVWWPELGSKLVEIRQRKSSGQAAPPRSTTDMLEEIVGSVRALVNRDETRRAASGQQVPRLDHPLFARLKGVLGIDYRVYMLNRDELNALIQAWF